MEVIVPRLAGSTAAAAMWQEGASCSYNACKYRCLKRDDASCGLMRVRVCGTSSLSRCCSRLGRSKMPSDFRECMIKQSVTRKKTFRPSRPTTFEYSYGVATQLEDSTDRGASCLDRLEYRSGISSGMQLDCWVEDAVFEIVKNVEQAPFFQFVFETNTRSLQRSKWQQVSQEVFEKPKCWIQLQDLLSPVATPPDGVIFVQRLDVTSCRLEEEDPGAATLGNDQRWRCPLEGDPTAIAFGYDQRQKCPLEANGSYTNMWGVLVQARSALASACYILKTTKVCSSTGLCTQFCLTRAKCFGPSIAAQLERFWLL